MSPEEFANKLRRFKEQVPEMVQISISAGIDELDAQMQNRIFNEHQTTTGQPLGKYKSEAYKEYRLSLGRQVESKDLQVFGTLRGSIRKNYPERVLEFSSQKAADIMEGQEKQIKGKIIKPSAEEKDFAIRAIQDTFYEQLNSLM